MMCGLGRRDLEAVNLEGLLLAEAVLQQKRLHVRALVTLYAKWNYEAVKIAKYRMKALGAL